MRKDFFKISLIFVFASSVYANDLKDAIALFEKKEYLKSDILLKKVFKDNPSNLKASFYMGLCAYELKMYEKALIAFERVLIMDENHNRTKLELARTYMKLKMFIKAKALFEDVLKTNPPKNVQKNIKKLLFAINAILYKPKTNMSLTFGIGYDDNINTQPNPDSMFSYFQDQNLSGTTYDTPTHAKYSNQVLYVSKKVPVNQNVSFDNSVLVYNKNYDNNKEFNVFFTKASTQLNYNTNDYRVSLPVGYSKVVVGSKSLYNNYEAGLKLSKALDKTTFSEIYANYKKKMNIQNDSKDRNTNVLDYGVTIKKNLNSHIMTLNYLYSKEYKQNQSSSAFLDKITNGFKISYFKNIYKMLNLNLGYSYSDIDYYLDNRRDKSRSYLIGLSSMIDKTKSISLNYSKSENKSSSLPLSYEKNDVNIKFNINF
jgi:tetratricopeptide (TPR) repeat protein